MVIQRWKRQKKTKQKEFKSVPISISRGKYKSQEQEGTLRNIKVLYKALENFRYINYLGLLSISST